MTSRFQTITAISETLDHECVHLELPLCDVDTLCAFERMSSRWQRCTRLRHFRLHISRVEHPSELARVLFGMANTGDHTFTVHWILDVEPRWKADVAAFVCWASDRATVAQRTLPPIWLYHSTDCVNLRLEPLPLTPLSVSLSRGIIAFPAPFTVRIGSFVYRMTDQIMRPGTGHRDDARTFANYHHARGHPYWMFLDNTHVWMMWLVRKHTSDETLLLSWRYGDKQPDRTIPLGTLVYPQAYVVTSKRHLMIHLGRIGIICPRRTTTTDDDGWQYIMSPAHESLSALQPTLANTWRQDLPLAATDRNLGVDVIAPSALLDKLDRHAFQPIHAAPETIATSPHRPTYYKRQRITL